MASMRPIRAGEKLLRLKDALDGAENLDQAIGMLMHFADELRRLRDEGFDLVQPIEGDIGFAHKKRGTRSAT